MNVFLLVIYFAGGTGGTRGPCEGSWGHGGGRKGDIRGTGGIKGRGGMWGHGGGHKRRGVMWGRLGVRGVPRLPTSHRVCVSPPCPTSTCVLMSPLSPCPRCPPTSPLSPRPRCPLVSPPCPRRLLGLGKVLSFAVTEWLRDIRCHQLPGLLGGVAPVHAVLRLCECHQRPQLFPPVSPAPPPPKRPQLWHVTGAVVACSGVSPVCPGAGLAAVACHRGVLACHRGVLLGGWPRWRVLRVFPPVPDMSWRVVACPGVSPACPGVSLVCPQCVLV